MPQPNATAPTLKELTTTFNIFDNGREFSGTDRGYILDNVRNAIEDPWFQERLKNREALGYRGHGIRKVAGLIPSETNVVKMGSAALVLDQEPSNVLVNISLDDEGNLTHTQQILDNAEGRKVLGLIGSKIGGWSWAARPSMKTSAKTLLAKIAGFDYVHNPNFNDNRSFVFDDADDALTEEEMLANMQAAGVSEEEAKETLEQVHDDAATALNEEVQEFSNFIFDSAIHAGVVAKLEETEGLLGAANEQLAASEQAIAEQASAAEEKLGAIFDSAMSGCGIVDADASLRESFVNGDSGSVEKIVGVIKDATLKAASMAAPVFDSVDNPESKAGKKSPSIFGRAKASLLG